MECQAIIRYKMKKGLSGEMEDKQPGQSTTLSKEEETQLAFCIRTLCCVNFSPTKEQIKYIVKEYVQLHQLSTPFKNDPHARIRLEVS